MKGFELPTAPKRGVSKQVRSGRPVMKCLAMLKPPGCQWPPVMTMFFFCRRGLLGRVCHIPRVTFIALLLLRTAIFRDD